MFLNKILGVARHPASVNQLSNLFQRCLISSTPAFQNKLTPAEAPQTARYDINRDPVKKINEVLKKDDAGRLFAVIQVCGKQFKVTTGDIILVEGHWEPSNGDELRLEKVLLCGSQDFTLVGRPILQNDLVNVQASVIEKSLSHTRTHFKFKKRKQYRRINFQRQITTTLRINSIEIKSLVDQAKAPAESLENVFY